MSSVRLSINGQEVQAALGATIREAALSVGLQTPTLCYHPHLSCGSNCRACIVELEGARTLVPACTRPVAEGMKVQTDSDRVRHSRKMVFELLLTEVDCDEAPELQAYARHYGADPSRYPATVGATKEREVIIDNPFFVRDYAKCIGCQRCVRACGDDIQHTFAIAMIGQGHQVSVGAGDAGNDITQSSCVFCGNCVGVCPTGALMPLAEFDARKEGLLQTPQIAWTPTEGFTGDEADLLAHPDAPGPRKEAG
jgi:NADH dehydrogenase/NADH:ubiquinone oxidoreductase subunit G